MTAGMERWRGKVAVVTGASAGIGRAVARALAEDGLKVAALARRTERLDELAAALPGRDVLPLACDVRDERQIQAAFARVGEAWGGVDVLVNNAGLGHKSPLASGSTEHWREMLEVNVLALCVCTREALSSMRARGDDGHVIHISSLSGHRVPSASGVYSATKYAVRSLTESLRLELRALGSAIRVSAISPGFVETEFAPLFHKRPEAAAETYGRYPVLTPEDIAESVRYVLGAPAHVQVHDILLRPTQQDT